MATHRHIHSTDQDTLDAQDLISNNGLVANYLLKAE